MPPKRRKGSRDSSFSDHSPKKRARSGASPESSDEEDRVLAVHIVQAKLDADAVTELYHLVEGFKPRPEDDAVQMELCSEAKDADIIITNVHMRRRFERHVPWNIARMKAIVTPDWLRESYKAGHPLACGDFAAFAELEEETIQNCPDSQSCEGQSHGRSHLRSPSYKPSYSISAVPSSSQRDNEISSYFDTPPSVSPTDPRVFNNWRERYACQRASPLVCPNQELVDELSVLCRDRELEGLAMNARAYERAVGIIKSYPKVITKELFTNEVSKLPGLGEKMTFKIEEYLKTGSIPEVQTTLASGRYQSLSLFASIYGIGPTKARQFYDMGMRTIEDLERYYDVSPGSELKTPAELDAALMQMEEETAFTPNGKPIKAKGKAPDITVPVALVLRGELDQPIPRDEVDEMHAVVVRELDELQPGCVSTVVGGYRRGKPMSNDVDIVISHRDFKAGKDLIPGLCKRFTARLYQKGLVTHVMHLSGFHSYNALRTEHWDSLEKALTVFKLPPSSSSPVRLHRRLDLIFALPESYWTAVIGWSGSKLFQRDLRLWAKEEKGMKFDSVGLTRRHDTKRFLPKSEKEVFDILGLPWIDPTMRNADA